MKYVSSRTCAAVCLFFASLNAFTEEAKPDPVRTDLGDGLAILCFPQDSGIPQRVRFVKRRTGEPFQPFLTDQDIDQANLVESLDLSVLRGSRDFDDPKPTEIVGLKDNDGKKEKVSEYIERIAARFDYTIPFIAEQIRVAASVFPERTEFVRPTRLGPIDDEIYRSLLPDPENCVMASVSRVSKPKDSERYILEYDGKILARASALDVSPNRNSSRLMRAILRLSDDLYYVALTAGPKSRDHARHLLRLLVTRGSGISVAEAFRTYRQLGFKGDPRVPDNDARNFYAWKLIHEVFEVLWNRPSSVYRSYEKEVIQSILPDLPRLKGCEFFSRKPVGDAYKIFDCRHLMEQGIWFPPIPPVIAMPKEAKAIAKRLLEAHSGFEARMLERLRDNYLRQYQEHVLRIPWLDSAALKKADEVILAQIQDGILEAHYAGPKDKKDRPVPYSAIGLSMDFPIPDQW